MIQSTALMDSTYQSKPVRVTTAPPGNPALITPLSSWGFPQSLMIYSLPTLRIPASQLILSTAGSLSM